ncbi:hypothetical protein MXB_3729, partial [Myxobolus squamalis]
EGVLRGKISTWIEIICFGWVDLIFHFTESSFIRCSDIQEIINILLKLEEVQIDMNFYF